MKKIFIITIIFAACVLVVIYMLNKNNNVNNTVSYYIDENLKVKRDNQILKSRIEELENQIISYKNENKQLNDKIEKLFVQKNEMLLEISTLNNKIESFEENGISIRLKNHLQAIAKNAVTIQYKENHGLSLKKFFTVDFIGKIDETFYKREKSPYQIERILVYKNEKDGVIAQIWITDRLQSYYFQNMLFKKINDEYYIDKIEYDI